MIETVLNWIAQGLAVAAATGVGLRLMGPARAHARYLTCWAALWVVVCLPLVPILWAVHPSTIEGHAGPAVRAGLLSVPQGVWNAPLVLGTVAALWVGGHLARLFAAARALRGSRSRCTPVSPRVLARLQASTRERLSQAGIRLASSTDIRAAAVLGVGSPIIAVHPALLEQLTDAQLDHVIVHEWAHVVRKDARATLAQQLLQAIVGWHPAVWWTNRQIHVEREMACDEMVVAVTGAARAYAACLTQLAALTRAPEKPSLALGAVGTSSLRRRVLRVLAWDGRPSAPRLLTPTFVALLIAMAIWSGNVRVFGSAIASAAFVEAQSLVALVGTVPPPHLATPSAVVEPPVPVIQKRIPPSRIEDRRVTVVPTETAPFTTRTGGAADELPVVAEKAVQAAPPAEPLAASSVPMGPVLLQAPAGNKITAQPRPSTEAVDVWNAATNAGEQIGRTSQKGAVATAGFFTRVAKNVARSF